jgi:hypothetical protein
LESWKSCYMELGKASECFCVEREGPVRRFVLVRGVRRCGMGGLRSVRAKSAFDVWAMKSMCSTPVRRDERGRFVRLFGAGRETGEWVRIEGR